MLLSHGFEAMIAFGNAADGQLGLGGIEETAIHLARQVFILYINVTCCRCFIKLVKWRLLSDNVTLMVLLDMDTNWYNLQAIDDFYIFFPL